MTASIADAAARARAIDPTRSFIVEAPAGSGKTALLTQRFLTLLAGVSEPEAIVAITFTRKAADEMRGRVLAALQSAQQAPCADPYAAALQRQAQVVLARDQTRHWGLLANPTRLRVLTIDALAATIARRLPLLAGSTGNFEVTDEPGVLYREAARQTLAELGSDTEWSRPVGILLGHLDNDWTRLEMLLAAMLPRRDQWLRFAARAPQRSRLEAALAAAVTEDLVRLGTLVPAALRAELLLLCQRAGAGALNANANEPLAILASLRELPGASLADVAPWVAIAELLMTKDGNWRKQLTRKQGIPPGPAGAEGKALFASLVSALEQHAEFATRLHATRRLPPTRYSDAQWEVLEALLGVLKLAAAQLRLLLNERSTTDFVEVAQAALNALGEPENPTDLSLSLDHRIQHLLVDEFQDTAVTQYALVERLTAGWTGEDGRTLFLVGDPLQSIYRFRQAEVQLFTRTTANLRLGTVPLEHLRLSVNFRAEPALIDWLNTHLPKVFAASGCDLPPFAPFNAARAPGAQQAVSIHAYCKDTRDIEAATVLRLVRHYRARQPVPRIAVLVRSRAHLGQIPAVLLEAGIPVAAADIDALDELPVVNDLMALTRALLQPWDRIAWLALLRAPWCGLTLPSIVALTTDAADLSVWTLLHDHTRCERLPPAEQLRLQRCREVLAEALTLRGRCPLAELVPATWLALRGPACLKDISESRYAERYFELLGRLEGSQVAVTPATLQEFIGRHFAPPPAPEGAAVEIMTIHRAKGLEFDVVILPGLANKTRPDAKRLLMWQEQVEADTHPRLLFAPLPGVGAGDEAIFAYLRDLEGAALTAETYRLLYVALTRARAAVHLLAGVDCPDGEVAAPSRNTLLGMLWPAVAGACAATALPAAAAPATTAALLRDHRLRRLALAAQQTERSRRPGEWVLQPAAKLEFEWASPTAKHVGTVIHEFLQLIAREGISRWAVERTAQHQPSIRARLRGLGVASSELAAAEARVLSALATVLRSERGRWLMSETHSDIHSEYHLTGYYQTAVVEAIIDRTFIDADGVRWIIDFKTGTHQGGAPETFMDSEVLRYRPQLSRYAQLMRQLESRPLALGLYFPLLDGWREWRE